VSGVPEDCLKVQLQTEATIGLFSTPAHQGRIRLVGEYRSGIASLKNPSPEDRQPSAKEGKSIPDRYSPTSRHQTQPQSASSTGFVKISHERLARGELDRPGALVQTGHGQLMHHAGQTSPAQFLGRFRELRLR